MVGWEIHFKHIVTSNYSFVFSVHTHTLILHTQCDAITDCQDGGWGHVVVGRQRGYGA